MSVDVLRDFMEPPELHHPDWVRLFPDRQLMWINTKARDARGQDLGPWCPLTRGELMEKGVKLGRMLGGDSSALPYKEGDATLCWRPREEGEREHMKAVQRHLHRIRPQAIREQLEAGVARETDASRQPIGRVTGFGVQMTGPHADALAAMEDAEAGPPRGERAPRMKRRYRRRLKEGGGGEP
jgi:hypothetical protein